jgi:hypothetical protein
MLTRQAVVHPVIDGIGMGETMHGVLAMAEGHDRRGRHEAKRCKSGDCHR